MVPVVLSPVLVVLLVFGRRSRLYVQSCVVYVICQGRHVCRRLLGVELLVCVFLMSESSALVVIVCDRVLVASTVQEVQHQVEVMELRVCATCCR